MQMRDIKDKEKEKEEEEEEKEKEKEKEREKEKEKEKGERKISSFGYFRGTENKEIGWKGAGLTQKEMTHESKKKGK